jgi:malonyl-CoA O-methyltransferase
MNLNQEIRKSFNHKASSYDEAALVQLEIGDRLFERLSYIKIQPKYILDLGCGTGNFGNKLQQLFPDASIVNFDIAAQMLGIAQDKGAKNLVCGDMLALPFADSCFDLIFSNQVLHWTKLPEIVIQEIFRVMSSEGFLLFSMLGPDSFTEMRNILASMDNFAHINDFYDMHDIGDILLQTKFSDPVMDMEKILVKYSSSYDMLKALKNQGVRNVHAQRRRGLTTKKFWQEFAQRMQDAYQIAPITYEIIYGHAWKIALKTASHRPSISLADLKATIIKSH